MLSYAKDLPELEPVDLIVCGAGPAGCAAALSAARSGLSVLLVEALGQCGGMGTSGLVSHWLGGRSFDGRRWIVGGIFRELSEEAAAAGMALLPVDDPEERFTPHGWLKGLQHGVPFDPFAMARLLDRKLAEASVEVLHFTRAVDVTCEGDEIRHVVLANKQGLSAVQARAIVDATGDADVAAASGCEVQCGREGDGLMAPATLMFHVDNVDQRLLSDYLHEHDSPRFRLEITRWREQGDWPFPYEILITVQLVEPGVMMVNTSRLVGVDGTDPRSVSKGMRAGREETEALLGALRKHVPGFSQARLKAVASLLGVRETRRILGELVMTVEDVATGRTFEDTIGLSSYGWDLPDPHRPSHQPMHERAQTKPPVTPLPYRIMVPRPVRNLICPGRAVSVEREVLGPLRVMAPCMAMGEAAGLAAHQVCREGIAFNQVDTALLRRELTERGAVLEL